MWISYHVNRLWDRNSGQTITQMEICESLGENTWTPAAFILTADRANEQQVEAVKEQLQPIRTELQDRSGGQGPVL